MSSWGPMAKNGDMLSLDYTKDVRDSIKEKED